MNHKAILRTATLTIWSLAAGLGVGSAAQAHTTPAQEARACALVTSIRNHQDQGVEIPRPVWEHAYHVADAADPDLRTAIHRYLRTGLGWDNVHYLCGYGL